MATERLKPKTHNDIRLNKRKMSVIPKPWYVSLGIFLIYEIVFRKVEYLPFIVHHLYLYELEEKSINYWRLFAIVFFIGAITFLKWWPQVGLKGLDTRLNKPFLEIKKSNLHILWPVALFFLIQLLYVSFSYLPPTRVLIILIINTILIGICEELMYRGILFYGASSSFGILRAVCITSIIFGASHTFNGFIIGDFNASIIQATMACFFGFWIAALRVRLDTIVPGIIIHWLWDFLAYLPSSAGTMLMFLCEIALIYYGLLLLRSHLPLRYRT